MKTQQMSTADLIMVHEGSWVIEWLTKCCPHWTENFTRATRRHESPVNDLSDIDLNLSLKHCPNFSPKTSFKTINPMSRTQGSQWVMMDNHLEVYTYRISNQPTNAHLHVEPGSAVTVVDHHREQSLQQHA